MRVALIAPPYPLSETPTAPLGLCYVAAAFEAANAEVIIVDYIVRKYSPEKLFQDLSAFDPDIIGATSVTMNFHMAASILKTAKELFPRAVTIMGGPHVTFDYENVLKQYPEIDLIVVGEGEQTIMELAPAINDRKSWSSIQGIAFMEQNRLTVTPKRDFIQDIDRLPFPSRTLLPLSRYLALGFPISIITSRGCPNQCIFCQGHRMVGHKVRNRDPKLVVDEIEMLLSHGFTRVNFSDDFFTSNVKRVRRLCDEIRKRGLKFTWAAFARADSVDQDLLTLMMEHGCDTVFFGIESGNQEMLDRIKKHVTLDRIRKAVADCKAVGMTVFASFIAGLPGESADTLMDSHRFAQELDVIYGYHFLAPFPGTEVKEKIKTYDLELLTDDWSRFDANRSIAKTSFLSTGEIENFVDTHYFQDVRHKDAETEKKYQEGKLTGTDLLVYLGNKKLDIVFKLLSGDIIENLPPILDSDSPLPPEHRLSGEISALIDNPPEFILMSIQHLVDQGRLKYETDGNQTRWQWA
jgi:anaerobic magnesium-protoporphyrin IX monomethyl ester cyclase